MTKPLVDLEKGKFNSAGKHEVQISDQTSPAVLIFFNKVDGETTVGVETAVDDMTVTVADATGITDGAYVGIFSTTTNRFYQGEVVGAPAGNVVTLDTPIDSVFPVGSVFGFGTKDMNVNGGTTTQVFGLRGADPGINVTVDITKIIIQMETSSAIDLNKFGNITALTNGLVMRGVDGITYNFGNIKTNADMVSWGAEFTPYDASNPGQGIYGLAAVFNFAGQGNAGVAIRVAGDESLEIWVQDNLTTITSLRISALGHVVDD